VRMAGRAVSLATGCPGGQGRRAPSNAEGPRGDLPGLSGRPVLGLFRRCWQPNDRKSPAGALWPGGGLSPISFKRHRSPATVIVQAVRWYFRFTLSIRDLEELMAERGIEVSREAIRCWVLKFGPLIAVNLRRRRCPPTGRYRPGGMRENNRTENSHLVIRRRERKQQKFKSRGPVQRLLSRTAGSTPSSDPRVDPAQRPARPPVSWSECHWRGGAA
jgi:hypothetical protein